MTIYPTICNVCGGKVVYEESRLYSSGYQYRCLACGAHVGTHKNRPREAMGILGIGSTGKLRNQCHELFDKRWRNSKGSLSDNDARTIEYARLAKYLGIEPRQCHFGYMDTAMLEKALKYLQGDT